LIFCLQSNLEEIMNYKSQIMYTKILVIILMNLTVLIESKIQDR
jgi:hypothetical protein